LLLSFGAVDVAPELGVLDDELLSEDAGGVAELDDEPVPLDDDEVSGVADELDDIEPLGDVGGVVDDDDVDGDGVTTGGVVVDVVGLSRLQPARPRTSPVQSSVTSALFIAISR